MEAETKKNRVGIVLTIAALIVMAGLIAYTNIFHYCFKMNADIAAEASLAQVIWESGQWIPDSWYTSSELRVCTTPNLAALFYGMVHDMALAMGLACTVMTLGILLSGYFLISQFSFNKMQKIIFLLLCLIMPSNFVILELFYLFASYYAVHVIIMFLTLGVYARLISGKPVHILWLCLIAFLPFFTGMQGVRGLLVLNVPLLATEILRQFYLLYSKVWDKKKALPVVCFTAGGVAAGYAGTLLPLSVGADLHRNIRKGFAKLWGTVLPELEECLGLTKLELEGRIIYFLFLLITVIIFAAGVWRVLKKQGDNHSIWVGFMFGISTAMTMIAVAFTTIDSSQRYYFVLLFGMAFAFTCFIRYANEKSLVLSCAGYALVFFLLVFQVRMIYLPIIQSEEPAYSEENEVCKYLEENGYEMAYADFERANSMTVLSGGRVRVASVASLETMEVCKWLSSSEWYVPNVPYESRTAYIVTEAEREDFEQFYEQHKEDIWVETQIGKFTVYGSEYNFSTLEPGGK
ncbi:MAG: hypothetical protein NC416_03780 [Eubacterium sp.]|nr:hypothetical protein [Eubacterium sp.]